MCFIHRGHFASVYSYLFNKTVRVLPKIKVHYFNEQKFNLSWPGKKLEHDKNYAYKCVLPTNTENFIKEITKINLVPKTLHELICAKVKTITETVIRH